MWPRACPVGCYTEGLRETCFPVSVSVQSLPRELWTWPGDSHKWYESRVWAGRGREGIAWKACVLGGSQ